METGLGMGMHNGIFGMPGMITYQIIILGLFFLVIYWFFRNNKSESAINILETRYAKGEISKTEFLKIKKDIK